MMGRTIKIFLVDGSPTGVLTAEIINWTGKVIVGPRALLVGLAERAELRRTGVYLLVGTDPEDPTKDRVYIGESDNVFVRLKQHETNEDKDFWIRTFGITSSDANLTNAHVRYLESRLIDITRRADRCVLDNVNNPAQPALPEADRADMEFFLAQVQMVLPVLGFAFTQPRATVTQPRANAGAGPVAPAAAQESPIYVMNAVGTNARLIAVGDKFIVLKNSTARNRDMAGLAYKLIRDDLVREGKLVVNQENRDLYVFNEDVEFSSTSAAASVVAAGQLSGPKSWRTEDGRTTYGELQAARLQQFEEKIPDGTTPLPTDVPVESEASEHAGANALEMVERTSQEDGADATQ